MSTVYWVDAQGKIDRATNVEEPVPEGFEAITVAPTHGDHVWDGSGWTDPTGAVTLAEITRLESLITPRRQREAILGADQGWLANIETLLAAERAKL